jgi:hypothetical protein
MATESISVAIKGGKMKKGKKQRGWGEGKDIVVTTRFSIATRLWRPKTFQSPQLPSNNID